MLITYDILPDVLVSGYFAAVNFNPVKSLKVNPFPSKPPPPDLPSIGLLSFRDTVAHVSTLPVDESLGKLPNAWGLFSRIKLGNSDDAIP
jgi:hypothetical protein